jgi:hypothetical protein
MNPNSIGNDIELYVIQHQQKVLNPTKTQSFAKLLIHLVDPMRQNH